MTEQLSDKIKEKIETLCKKYKVESDLIDFHALYDRTITEAENFNILEELIKISGGSHELENKNLVEGTKKAIKNEKEIKANVEIEQLKKEAEESERIFDNSIKEIKENKSEILEKLYHIPREFINSVIRGKTISLILTGKQARGKSYLTIETLTNGKAKFRYFSGFTSPMALYKLLYENKDEGIINVFDDTQGLMSNKEALPLMLNALYSITSTRKIMWNTTSGKLGGIPTTFTYDARTILITNELPKNVNTTLILSRCLPFEFNPTNKELLAMMYEIAKQDSDIPKEKRLEIVDFIKNFADGTCRNFDLRVQKHIENLYRYDNVNWRELSTPLLSRDEKLVLLKQFLKESISIKEAEQKFMEKFNVCRKTFYNKKLELEMGVKV